MPWPRQLNHGMGNWNIHFVTCCEFLIPNSSPKGIRPIKWGSLKLPKVSIRKWEAWISTILLLNLAHMAKDISHSGAKEVLVFYTRSIFILWKVADVIMYCITDYGRMMTRSLNSTAQIHIPFQNRKSCKIYENLSFLLKKWLSNAKSRTKDTQWQHLNI